MATRFDTPEDAYVATLTAPTPARPIIEVGLTIVGRCECGGTWSAAPDGTYTPCGCPAGEPSIYEDLF